MADITYYVALPFLFTDDGLLPGNAVEMPKRVGGYSPGREYGEKICNAGAIAFCRNCNPDTGEFSDATVLRKFGDVPNDLSAL
jgi:hypothetical protein